MPIKTRDMTLISLISILFIIGGYILYHFSKIIFIPGGKFVFFSSYISLILYLAISKIKKIKVISLISIIIGFILSMFSPLMGIAIIITGLTTDIITTIFLKNYNNKRNMILSVSFFPLISFNLSIFVSNYVTGNILFGIFNIKLLILMSIIIWLLALIGGFAGYILNKKFLKHFF